MLLYRTEINHKAETEAISSNNTVRICIQEKTKWFCERQIINSHKRLPGMTYAHTILRYLNKPSMVQAT